MKPIRHLLLVAAMALAGVCARSQARAVQPVPIPRGADSGSAPEARSTNVVVTVTDGAGQPVPGATVEYWTYTGTSSAPELKQQATTGADGSFAFPKSREQGLLVARKTGMAPSWMQLGRPYAPVENTNISLTLTPPVVLAGVVVNEDGKPVPDADVVVATASREILREDGAELSVNLSGAPAKECFSARTDGSGHFRFGNWPANVSAALTVQSPGKALKEAGQAGNGFNSLPWQAGQEDVKLEVEPAGIVEGKIVMTETNRTPPIATLTLQPDNLIPYGHGRIEPVKSGPDGIFRILDVPAGPYHLSAAFGTNSPPEWLAESVPVEVVSGQTTRNVQLTATAGGLLEVIVRQENDHKLMGDIRVTAQARTTELGGGMRVRFQGSGLSDTNGLARLRLFPGEYQVFSLRPFTVNEAVSATVEPAATNRLEMEVPAPQKITATVRAPDGQPAGGVALRFVGSSELSDTDPRTDPAGKFEFERYPQQNGQGNLCVIARDVARNLAAAADVDDSSGSFDLKLEPALTLVARVESEGKAVTNARAQLIFWTGNSGSWLSGFSRASNAPGLVELQALPPGRKYGLAISAPGYGQKMINEVSTTDAGRQVLDPIELVPANLKLAGRLLDAEDKPVPGCQVRLSGDGQPNASARTDRDGRFVFEHVCEGSIQLSANGRVSDSGIAFGNVVAEGGDTNVVLQLGQTQNQGRGTSLNRLHGIITDAGGKPAAGAQVAVFPTYLNGTRGVRTGTDGAYKITWPSRQRWQNGSPLLIVRDINRNLIATAELDETTTNLDAQLKPALTLTGLIQSPDGAPLAGAQVEVSLNAGNTRDNLGAKPVVADAQGRYELKCLPLEGEFIVSAFAKDHGRKQMPVSSAAETNRVELPSFVLPPANLMVGGQVLDDNEQPVGGANVSISGTDQPSANMTTDRKGQFHFKVCEGTLQISANGKGLFGNISAEAGDTNVVLQLGQNQMNGGSAHRLTGTVSDAEGKPVGGAQISVVPSNSGNTGGVRSGTNGEYHLTWSPWLGPQGSYLVMARAASRNLAAAEVLDEETTNLNVQLKPALSLVGRVQEPGGEPLAGAQVGISIRSGNSTSTLNTGPATADAQGRFEIKCLPPEGRFIVYASAKDHSQAQVEINGDAGSNRVEVEPLVLKPANLAVAGQVLDASDKPVAGANVSMNGAGQPSDNTTTDRKGQFRFKVCEGTVQLNANGNNQFANMTVDAGDTNVVLQLGQNMMGGAALHRLKGVVTDPDGKPASKALVSIFPPSNGRPDGVRTGTNGDYRLSWSVWPGQWQPHLLLARDTTRDLAGAAEPDEDTTNLDVRMKPALTLTGVVQGPGGAPLAGAQIEVSLRAGNTYGSLNAQPAVTDAQGRFELKGLPLNGQFMVSASAKDHGRMQRQVENESGTNRLELTSFVLKSADQVVAGQVVDDNDKPVAGASVSITGVDQASASVTTDKKGAFRLKVCEGMAQLNANNNSGMSGNMAVQSGHTNVVLRIGRNMGGGMATQRLNGTVTDPDGKPVAKALLSVSPSMVGPATPVRSGSNGEYRLTWSTWPGQAQLEVLLARDAAHNLAAVEEVTPLTTNLDVQLKPALTIAGRVEDAKGAPLAGAQIYASISIGNSMIQFGQTPATSDAQGRYEIKCLPPGRGYSIAVSAKGHGNNQQLCPADTATNRVELTALVLKTADRIVAGQLLDENDKPVSGVYVSLSGTDQPSDNMMTDRQGRFHFKVCEGGINLSSGSQFGFAQASVEAGDTNIVLTLTPPGRPGRMPLQGQPLPDLTTVKLAADAAPAGKPVLLCIFDVAKPASRQTVQTLAQQAAALWQRNITVLGVQSATITDDDFRAWKTANPVVFPVGRVTKKTDESRWATSVPRLPWLILTDGLQRVVSEGFSVDKLEVQLKKLRLDTVPDVR